MTPTLERLAELVRQAESKSRAQRLGGDVRQAAETLKAAEIRAEEGQRRVREDRPTRLRELREVADQDKLLREMTIKLAQHRSYLETDSSEAERLVQSARAEIESKRIEAQKDLDSIIREAAESQKALQIALEKYTELREELDRLQPQLAVDFCEADRLVSSVARLFPSSQIPELTKEIEDGAAHFGALEAREQKAQLMIWIGRLRRLQGMNFVEGSEETQAMEGIFRRLVGLSKQYMPGYIDAFQEGYVADWDQYIVDAQEQFRLAVDASRRDRELRVARDEQALRELERKRLSQSAYRDALQDLRAVIASHHLPEEGVDEFLAALGRVVNTGGTADAELLDLIKPYRELVTGSDFRVLRKHLDRLRDEDSKVEEDLALRGQFAELISQTRGRRVLMIGGAVREDARRTLCQFFEFGELEWEPYEGTRPALLKSLEQRVRNRGVDVVLILKEFVAHHVPERLRPLCQESGLPCLMVEHGYGASQLAEALRSGLKAV
ncbi:hypothetical protein P12x_002808 [Tundrisphaera lichenicola]|uniref:hypothetical protein n=1 Tax=Tundrisphaera lichenicola TaxID=2029860 RepID=UPI003EBECA7D